MLLKTNIILPIILLYAPCYIYIIICYLHYNYKYNSDVFLRRIKL